MTIVEAGKLIDRAEPNINPRLRDAAITMLRRRIFHDPKFNTDEKNIRKLVWAEHDHIRRMDSNYPERVLVFHLPRR